MHRRPLPAFRRYVSLMVMLTAACTPVAPPQDQLPPSPSHSLPPTTTPSPAPTPDVLLALSQAASAVLSADPLDTDALAAQSHSVHTDDTALLEQVPLQQRPDFLLDYLSIQTHLSIIDEVPSMVQDPNKCPSRGYLIVPTTDRDASPVPYGRPEIVNWGPPEEAYDYPIIAILCDQPEEGLQQVQALRAETASLLTAQEPLAEAVISGMLQEFLQTALGEALPVRVDIVPTGILQLTTYNTETAEILASAYYPFPSDDDLWHAVYGSLASGIYSQYPRTTST